MRPDSYSTSVSTQLVPPSNSNLASTFAASLSRPFSFTHSVSSSPPSQPRKRLSSLGPPGVRTSFFGKGSTITEDASPNCSLSVSNAEDDEDSARAPVFKTKLKNQQQFPESGYAELPLLDPEKSRGYREAYAHMLFVWDMPFAACEVLKYNGAALPDTAGPTTASSALAFGKTNGGKNDAVTQQGLSLRGVCLVCDTAFANGGEETVCSKCSTPKMPLTCLFCDSIIRGLASPCLSCGHTLHSSCRTMLSAQQSSDGFSSDDLGPEGTCVSGCGCRCSDHPVVELEDPRYEIREDSTRVNTFMAEEEETTGWHDQTGDDG